MIAKQISVVLEREKITSRFLGYKVIQIKNSISVEAFAKKFYVGDFVGKDNASQQHLP